MCNNRGYEKRDSIEAHLAAVLALRVRIPIFYQILYLMNHHSQGVIQEAPSSSEHKKLFWGFLKDVYCRKSEFHIFKIILPC